MAWFFIRAVAFALGLGIALPAIAACPPGFPLSSTCTSIEQYTYAAPQGQALAPYSSGLRIPVAPSPADSTLMYIPANLLATLNDTQTLTRKTLTNPIINSGTLNGTFSGAPIFSGIPSFTGLSPISCSLGLALDSGGRLGTIACGGGGSGGFPITLGSTTINGSSTNTAITGLTLSNGALSGNTGGNPNFTGQPVFSGLPSGTCAVGLALDSGNHLVTTVCGGGGGSGVTGNYTVASSCTGSSCTPVTQCWALSAGLVSSISTGACGGGGGNTLLADDGVTVLLADDGVTQLLAQ